MGVRPESYIWLVHRVAGQVAGGLPASVPLDDLIQAGMKGLVESASRFDRESGTPFSSFAFPRIRGAMLDHLRSLDSLSREGRRRVRLYQQAKRSLTQALGREPDALELAEFMDRPLDDVWRDEAMAGQDVWRRSAVEGETATSRNDPHREVEHEEVRRSLTRCLGELPVRDYLVLVLYYVEELTMADTASVLGLTESAVSQRHRSAIQRVGRRLRSLYRADGLRYGF